jgi:hypothetical protein
MGSRTFDFLTESFLFKDALIQDKFRTISEQEILDELHKYREFCLSNQAELENEVLTNTSSLKVISDIEMPDLNSLKQSAFYIEQYVVNDPIFSLGYRENEVNKAMNSYLGLNEKSINKSNLAKVVAYVKALTPMVFANYVKLLPINLFLEPSFQLPILYSENLFSDVLPEPIINFFHNNVIINSVERSIDNSKSINLNKLQPCREIMFRFKNYTGHNYGYNLFQTDFNILDEEEGQFQARMNLPDEPPDRDSFVNWVNQSFYLSCKQLYDEIFEKNLISNRFGASYLSESRFVFELLSQFFSLENKIASNTANILLNMELPFLDKVDIPTLMSIRLTNGEEFKNFRLHLDKQFRELRLVKDPEELRLKADNALHELSEVQIHAIKQRIGQIRRVGSIDAVVLLGGLLASVQTGEWSIVGLSAAVAAARGYKPFVDYSNQIKQNPAFFLWKVLEKSLN